jgi:polyisoprenoid-binding protein YceI
MLIGKSRLLLWVVFLGCTATAVGQELAFQLDTSQSNVQFTLGDVLHTVHGTFRMKESTVRFDPKTGKAGGALLVDATSGDTGNKSRDKKMHKDILESAKYPEIRFTVQSVRGTLPQNGTAQVEMSGILNLHGADHPFTVAAPVQVSDGRATADVKFTVPYQQWGLKNPSTFILRVSDKVDIVVHAAGAIAIVH